MTGPDKNHFEAGSVRVNAEDHDNAVAVTPDCHLRSTRSVDLQVDREYTTLRMRIGVTDDSRPKRPCKWKRTAALAAARPWGSVR
ncbi:hypothetical protein GCM10010492_59420 [Saccharothrix mutabilis subsp. mutabilis]|uniref:Uncharacterized protein n=1 Tax=Saccharothrix mutabilis subsp. mutabilis TaxID=66855 RepID=A0ABP3E375_9PSEU